MQADPLRDPGRLPEELRRKLGFLRDRLEACGPALLAVSGGIDSRVLAACARLWAPESQAIVFTGPQFPPEEAAYASEFLSRLGLGFELETALTLALPEVAGNTRQRCYACKKSLFSRARELAGQRGFRAVLEGSQRSDEGGYRPGKQALGELGIQSPLFEAGLFKPEVRSLAGHLGLSRPDQPARPCLLTRFAYGSRIEIQDLRLVARIEEEIGRLGFGEFRLRVPETGRCLLQIDEAERQLAEEAAGQLEAVLAGSGFRTWSIRIVKTLSGFFDPS